MSGTPNQVEWAGRIKLQVDGEFSRVASAFQAVAARQSKAKRAETMAILGILEEKRAAVMSRDEAGYFIREWQEMGDRVRMTIFEDPRYKEIMGRRYAAGAGRVK